MKHDFLTTEMTTTTGPKAETSQETQPEAELLLQFKIQWEFDDIGCRTQDLTHDLLTTERTSTKRRSFTKLKKKTQLLNNILRYST